MSATINDVLDQIKTDLTAALAGEANEVYGYRTGPIKLSRTVTITYIGGLPTSGPTAGQFRYYDFACIILAEWSDTAASLEAAERDMNTIENLIYDKFDRSKNSLWNRVEAFQPSIRPPTPPSLPKNYRYGEVYLRMHIK